MDYQENGFEDVQSASVSLKDRLQVIRYYYLQVLTIILLVMAGVVLYVLYARNIYTTTAQIKISKPKSNILEAPAIYQEFAGNSSDRFISTDILVLKSKKFRYRVAAALIDSVKAYNSPGKFYKLLSEPPSKSNTARTIAAEETIAGRLGSMVSVEQQKNVDIIQISVESPSAFEAALIANCYVKIYQIVSTEFNRNQLTLTKNFLFSQREEKLAMLNKAENEVKNFQEKVGYVSLDDKVSTLIEQLSGVESQLNMARIDLKTSDNALEQYSATLAKSDPKIARYVESSMANEYLKAAQVELAKLQLSLDLARMQKNSKYLDPKVEKETEAQINDLKNKITHASADIKNDLIGEGIDEVKAVALKALDEKIKNQALRISAAELSKNMKTYEAQLNSLPKSSIEFAALKRNQESTEKLYTLVEGRFQEAIINEQSQPGYVTVVDDAEVPDSPSKPNRKMILLIGLLSGIVLSVASAFVRDYFDDTLKTPEDIEKKNINLLAWIPPIERNENNDMDFEFVVHNTPKAMASEAFRVLRTRIQFSKLKNQNIKSILVTSAIPGEGKTTVAANLAGSLAQSDFKTIIIDCDFRKPRVHSFFKSSRTPGLVDYLFGKATLEEIIYPSGLDNLSYMPCGTIPPNPAEILQSQKFKEFFASVCQRYDFVLVDSPPVIAVADAELIAQSVDVSIIIAMADFTRLSVFEKVVKQFQTNTTGFAGVVLNNFNYTSSYGSYYKYYYYYYGGGETSKNRKKNNLKRSFNNIKRT
jgi:tyrosine-protein kinase Etk/Wzc